MLNLYLGFVDFEKAFYSIDHPFLWQALKKHGKCYDEFYLHGDLSGRCGNIFWVISRFISKRDWWIHAFYLSWIMDAGTLWEKRQKNYRWNKKHVNKNDENKKKTCTKHKNEKINKPNRRQWQSQRFEMVLG